MPTTTILIAFIRLLQYHYVWVSRLPVEEDGRQLATLFDSSE